MEINWNKRGKSLWTVGVTSHAFNRFKERYRILNPSTDPCFDTLYLMEKVFSNTNEEFSPLLTERNKKYSADARYFSWNGCTFVIVEDMIVTIEISRVGKLILNRNSERVSRAIATNYSFSYALDLLKKGLNVKRTAWGRKKHIKLWEGNIYYLEHYKKKGWRSTRWDKIPVELLMVEDWVKYSSESPQIEIKGKGTYEPNTII